MRSLVILFAVFVCMLVPSVGWAGSYTVTACFGTENASWSEWEPSPFATAYTACPGGALDLRRLQSIEGMMVRNVIGPGLAPRDAAAAMRFDAPAGTTITGLDVDVRTTSNPGWDAGIHDAWNDRWLWCGPRCWSSFYYWMHEELRGLSTQRVQALVRCVAARCRRDARHGFVAIRNVRVYLDDPSPPAVGGVRGSLVSAQGAWLRGGGDAWFDAADNSGVQVGRIELDGRVVHDDWRACDFTRPVPCSNGVLGASFDTRTWSDGEHVLRMAAADAAGNWASVDRVVRVDNTPPAEVAPVLDGGSGWNPSRVRRLLVRPPGGQAAPLVRARVKACRVGGGCEDSAPALEPSSGGAAATGGAASGTASAAGASAPVAAFDGPGEYAVRVALEDAAGNVGPFAAPVTMRFDDVRPGAPDVSAADAWRNGGALPLDATGIRPVSGIRGYRVRIGGRQTIVATSLALDGVPEGGTPVEVTAISGAGLEGTTVRTLLKLDRSRPSASIDGAPDEWSREPVRLVLRGRDQLALSGVRSVAWQVDGGLESGADGDVAVVEVADDGRHIVSYRAIDGAGNESEQRAVAVKVDRTPPETVAFEAPDPADPRRVRVVVADRTSGVASGRIELRRAGAAWRPVKTTFEGDRLVAVLDDAVLPAGAYELRARVTDVAGNETVGTRRADGTPVVLTLPLRRRTSLAVRRVGRLLRARLRAGLSPLVGREVTLAQRLRGRTRWRPVCAGRIVVIPRSTSASRAPLSPFVRRAPVSPPATRAPVSRAPVARLATRAPVSAPAAISAGAGSAAASADSVGCALRTDGSGRVDVRLPKGPSRNLRFSFAGDALLLPARGSTSVRTPARVRLSATPAAVPAGGVVHFSGRLLGGHVPRAGKLVELQARIGAAWRTFATVRSDRRGRIRHTRRFAPASAGSTFRIRLRVPRERSYPFETGRSPAVVLQVL